MRGMWATLLLLAAPTLAPAESWSVDRLPFPLESGWLFRRGHDPAWSSPFREKTHWQPIRVTGPWERQGFRGYNGHAWYRLTFQLPSRFAAETLGVDLGTLGDVDEVFLNGQRIGSSGSFPPLYEPATLKRRIYRLPRVSLRYGEFNELSVHVYNEGRFGGFLGPPPVLDRYETLLARQTGRDVVLWVGAAFLAVLALFHGALSLFYGGGREQWPWVTFLLIFAGYQITYASFGPGLWWGSGFAFRLNVIALLLAVGTFALVIASQTRGPIPTPAVVFASVMGVGAGFAALWRRSVDLYLWVYFAELAILVLVALALWWFFRQKRSGRAWTLVLASVPFFATVLLDVAVDLCLLPRPGRGLLLLYSSLGVVPFALAMSVTLTTRWA
ncbi:MAG: hypothetical protein NZ869_02735, partial [Thermoanaerobaculum sp.]|nr:hypothetical protein [Thermoanaerobaculum sp.]MDW7967206.1 hypothetical protein [Thermoanaerobaculum sp.]